MFSYEPERCERFPPDNQLGSKFRIRFAKREAVLGRGFFRQANYVGSLTREERGL